MRVIKTNSHNELVGYDFNPFDLEDRFRKGKVYKKKTRKYINIKPSINYFNDGVFMAQDSLRLVPTNSEARLRESPYHNRISRSRSKCSYL